jgi:uncharacterized damage-inducible protein DinB
MDERFPIGAFTLPAGISREERIRCMESIESHPRELRRIVEGLDDADLGLRYREGGWTIRQVVHHLADSHVNAYVRFKLALTEDEPRIKTYEEARWAELPDTDRTPVEVSVRLLEALHARWTELLRGMTDEPTMFARRLSHPEWGMINLDQMLALYGWHGPHHVAHIRMARGRGLAAGTP